MQNKRNILRQTFQELTKRKKIKRRRKRFKRKKYFQNNETSKNDRKQLKAFFKRASEDDIASPSNIEKRKKVKFCRVEENRANSQRRKKSNE